MIALEYSALKHPFPDFFWDNYDSRPSVQPNHISNVAQLPRVQSQVLPDTESVVRDAYEATEADVRVAEQTSSCPPALRLPPDLVEMIFLDCLYSGALSTVFPPPPRTRTPLHFGHICRSWRTVALSIPQLWSVLTVDFAHAREAVSRGLVHEWFARSGEMVPLQLTCTARSAPGPLVDTVLEYAHRWSRLDLGLPVSALAHFSREQGTDRFRALEELALRLEADGPMQQVTVFKDAPKLRTLLLPTGAQGVRIAYPVLPLFPGHQITHFESGYPLTPHETLDFLSRCTALVECSIAIDAGPGRRVAHTFGPAAEERGGARIVLAALARLRLQTRIELSGLFQSLELPALADLELAGESCLLSDALTGLLQRSTCALERFCLRDVISWPFEVVQCLRAMPRLVELELVSPRNAIMKEYLDEDALLLMTDRGQPVGELLLPVLEVLTLDRTTRPDTTGLVEMLRSRGEGGREKEGGQKRSVLLRSVQLEVPEEWNTKKPEVLAQLRGVGELGISVRLVETPAAFHA